MAELRQIVRIINADILGANPLRQGLMAISGVGPSFSIAVCNALPLNIDQKIGSLSIEDIKKIEDVIKNPGKYGIPNFLYNRKKDPETGLDKHIITSELKLTNEFDVKKLKKIKSYRGIRHALGLPVRGQKTRSNFRKGKSVGVSKKKAIQATPKKTEGKKEGKK